MLAVTALGFILTGAATLIGFARLDADYNAARLVRKEAAVAKSLGFVLRGAIGDTVEGTSLSWTVMPGIFADRIVEIEAVQDYHWLSIAWTAACMRPSVTRKTRGSRRGRPRCVDCIGPGRGTVGSANGQRGLPRLLVSVELSGTPRGPRRFAVRIAQRKPGQLDFVRNLGAVFALVFAAVALAFLLTRSMQPLARLGGLMDRMEVGPEVGGALTDTAAGSDEISVLVERYNRMVENVRRSALALARSERESAWREMAMQVAHEIKNPLTPMKLGIRNGERAWRVRPGGAEGRIVALSSTLQGQIDLLSRIADEFGAGPPAARGDETPVDAVLFGGGGPVARRGWCGTHPGCRA